MKNLSLLAAVAVISALCLGIAGLPTTQPPAKSGCGNAVADIMFVLDESGSVGRTNYVKMKSFVSNLVESFTIGPKNILVGALSFSNEVNPRFQLNTYSNKGSVLEGIDKITYGEGSTDTDKVLDYLRTTSFTQAAGDRKDAPNIAVILTDGRSNEKDKTIKAAIQLRDSNVIVFAIGIGKRLDEDELKAIGNSPTSKYVFKVDSFDALKSIESELVRRTCEVDPCDAKPCKNGGVCSSNGDSYKCTCKTGYSGTNCETVTSDCVCKVSGDPHYVTFDQQLIHFMGPCKYTLASTTNGSSLTEFSVEAKNERRGDNNKVSYIRLVDIKVNGVTLRLLPKHKISVNNQILQMPLYDFMAFNATYSSGWVTVTTSFGLEVEFDGDHRVYIKISSNYRGQLTGLCGDCNGKKDDFRTKEGIDVSTDKNKFSLIGTSYNVLDDSDKPEKVCDVEDVVTNCSPETTRVCGLMTTTSAIFGECLGKLGKEVAEQYLESCRIDVCAFSMTTKYKTTATCKAFESFAKECEENGVLVNWRPVFGCELDCSLWANTISKFNVSNNQPSCTNINPTPTAFLTDGCVCKENYVLSGKECVPKSECGCMYNGMYLKVNTTILSSDCSKLIACLGNGKLAESFPCPIGSDCLIEFGERKCRCPASYAPLNGECIKTLPPPPPPIVDPDFLTPVMHMFIRVSVAYIKGTVLEEIKYEHVEQCAHKCLKNAKCKSFNFDDLVKNCQLYAISATTDITLTPSECPYREYYQLIESKNVVVNGATIITCTHLNEYSNIKTEAECKKLRNQGNYTVMEYSDFFQGCGITHNSGKPYGLTGNMFWKFELTLDKIPKMTKIVVN